MTPTTQVTLAYRLRGDTAWHTQEVSLDDFFDPMPGERPTVGTTWKHLALTDFLPVPMEELANTRLVLYDPPTQLTMTVTEAFWNNGHNKISERTDRTPKGEKYWELITSTRVGADPPLQEIMRIIRKEGIITLRNYWLERVQDGGAVLASDERVSIQCLSPATPALVGLARCGNRLVSLACPLCTESGHKLPRGSLLPCLEGTATRPTLPSSRWVNTPPSGAKSHFETLLPPPP